MTKRKIKCDRCFRYFNDGFYNNNINDIDGSYTIEYFNNITDNWYKNLCLKCFDEVEFIVIIRYDKKLLKSIIKILNKLYYKKKE